ncbi:c-type cytochrome [Pontibacter sp. G13]|uniref:c-type cytochrome n=1 Tax=Pontibacter sp. G13 TaxID=3074898 RepID=UPI00288A2B3A|nr:c-type cytochrome [Pontibacter sp. G13]WNJ21110.1 c-type cytochrome [Pontibacter sp. G13]
MLGTLSHCQRPDTPDPDIPEPPEVPDTTEVEVEIPIGTHVIPASPQRIGDPESGRDYLIYGDYLRSGIPYAAFLFVQGQDPTNELDRIGDNRVLNYAYTAVDAPNGVRIVGANCLQCHADTYNGELIVGLGNAHGDFTFDVSTMVPQIDAGIQLVYGNPSPEWEAWEPVRKSMLATGPYSTMPTLGVNPADQISLILALHRDPNTLAWSDTSLGSFPLTPIPTDVPPWWHMKKKHALYYNGAGRGDFAKFLMTASLMTLSDSGEARRIDRHFEDVVAYIQSLEAPTYPEQVDDSLVAIGEVLFAETCSKCHGTYGTEETYPNLLVDLPTIGTDPSLAHENFAFAPFVDWYKESWFSQGSQAAALTIEPGYVAPPLDGVWVTAPYFHNGSVPTLEGVLNSQARPTLWRRSFTDREYDHEAVGWVYEGMAEKQDLETYDTREEGYGNQGHTFGDHFSDAERKAVIEYLKTL